MSELCDVIFFCESIAEFLFLFFAFFLLRKIVNFLPSCIASYIQRDLFEILLNKPEIRFYLSFSGWFETKRRSVWFPINRKMVNTIWFWGDLIRFRKDFSVCDISSSAAPFDYRPWMRIGAARQIPQFNPMPNRISNPRRYAFIPRRYAFLPRL